MKSHHLLFFLFFFLSLKVLGQGYPVKQNIGSPNTLLISPGATETNLINYAYFDTTAANSSAKNNFYAGAQIVTTSMGFMQFWIRSPLANKWELQGNGSTTDCYVLLDGGIVTWSGSGLIMDVSPANYRINCVPYHSPQTQITLTTANPSLPRLDVIYVDVNNTVGKLTGTPNANPVKPQINPATQLELTTVLVPAAATTPPGFIQTIIYDENLGQPTEWNPTTTGTVNFDNTINPFHLTKAADASNGQNIVFTTSTPITLGSYSALKFYIRAKTPLPTDVAYIYLGTPSFEPSPPIPVLINSYGFDAATTGVYQTITIPTSAFNYSGQVNKITFAFGSFVTSFYLDYVQLQSGGNGGGSQDAWGLTGTPGTNPTINFLGPTDNVDMVFKTNNIEKFRLIAAGGNSSDSLLINGGSEPSYWMRNRIVGLGFPVSVMMPKDNNKNIAFDIMPRGTPGDFSGNGIAWMDICNANVSPGAGAVATARVGVTPNAVQFGSMSFGGASSLPVQFLANGINRIQLDVTGNSASFNIGKITQLQNIASDYVGSTIFNTNNATSGADAILFIGNDFASNRFVFGRWTNGAFVHSGYRYPNSFELVANQGAINGITIGAIGDTASIRFVQNDGGPAAGLEFAKFQRTRFAMGIGSNSVTPSAIAEFNSTRWGILLPRMNTAQQNAIISPATSLLIYNTDSSLFRYYNGSIWVSIGAGSAGGGTLVAVIGTADRITSSGGTSPQIDIASTYIGQSSITTLGTIVTGVWNGSTIAIANGGSGQTTPNAALNAFLPSQTGNSSKVLTTDGTNTSWTTVSGGGGVTTVGAFSGSAQTNGATISGSTITFGPASATIPGMVSTGSQTWAGSKIFTTAPTFSSLTAGRVLFTGTGGLTQATNELTWDGTTFAATGTGTFGEISIANSLGSANLKLGSNSSSGLYIQSVIGQKMEFFLSSFIAMRINSSADLELYGALSPNGSVGTAGQAYVTSGISGTPGSWSTLITLSQVNGLISDSISANGLVFANAGDSINLIFPSAGFDTVKVRTIGDGIGGYTFVTLLADSAFRVDLDTAKIHALVNSWGGGGGGSYTATSPITLTGSAFGLDTTTTSGGWHSFNYNQTIFGKLANPLSQFAATTSSQLAGVMSDETGTSLLVFNTSPLFVTPRLASTSTTGQFWIATDNVGNGSFQTFSITGKLNISDTAAMLQNYYKSISSLNDSTVLFIKGGTGIDTLRITYPNTVTTGSGTYTPSLTNTTNIAASTPSPFQYSRTGNTVTVSGEVAIDPSTASLTVLTMTIPITSNFANTYEAAGTASDELGTAARVRATTSASTVQVRFTPSDLTNRTFSVHFTYQIL